VISSGSSCLSQFSHTLYTGPNPWEVYHTCSNVLICVVYTILEKKKRKYVWSTFIIWCLYSYFLSMMANMHNYVSMLHYVDLYKYAILQHKIQPCYSSQRTHSEGGYETFEDRSAHRSVTVLSLSKSSLLVLAILYLFFFFFFFGKLFFFTNITPPPPPPAKNAQSYP